MYNLADLLVTVSLRIVYFCMTSGHLCREDIVDIRDLLEMMLESTGVRTG